LHFLLNLHVLIPWTLLIHQSEFILGLSLLQRLTPSIYRWLPGSDSSRDLGLPFSRPYLQPHMMTDMSWSSLLPELLHKDCFQEILGKLLGTQNCAAIRCISCRAEALDWGTSLHVCMREHIGHENMTIGHK
jgi:hypothetical protein